MKRFLIYIGILLLIQLKFEHLAAQVPKVIATTSFIADIAKNIAGKEVVVESLLPVGTDPHSYEPVPADVEKLLSAQLILQNGLGLEGWMTKMIANAQGRVPIITVTQGVEALTDPEHPNSHDPHAWMDPLNGVIYAQNIYAALVTILPAKKSIFESNFNQYNARLQNLHQEIQNLIQQIPPNQRYLITSHDAFRYYAKRYNLSVVSLLGTSTDADVQLGTVKVIDSVLTRYQVPAVFIESTVNPQMLQQIASDRKIVVGGKLFSDSLDEPGQPAGTYVGMLRKNTQVIYSGLTANTAGLAVQQKEISFLIVAATVFGLAFMLMYRKVHPHKKIELSWEKYSIAIKGVSVTYDKKTALTNVYLDIEPGAVYGLVGANGSGKSTLLKSILGLQKIDTGKILINGKPVHEVRPYIAYVPQKEEIDWQFPATVYDVVLMGCFPHKRVFEPLRAQDHTRTENALKALDIWHLKDQQIGELSGGQQQRAFIARALCQNAEIYFFDEPFVGVDVTTEEKIMQIIRKLADDKKLVVIIHHDLSKVNEYFDRLILLNRQIIAVGPTKTVFTQENIRRTFGGQLTILQQADHYL